jgi:hypothetical protein
MKPAGWLIAVTLATAGCPGPSGRNPGIVAHDAPGAADIVESAYAGGLQRGWAESGSLTRDLSAVGPARVLFGDAGVWRLTKVGLSGTYGALVFRVKEPEGQGEFLQVRLASGQDRTFRAVKLQPDHCSPLATGWTQVRIPMRELDPDGVSFDTIAFEPFRSLGNGLVLFDTIGLTRAEGDLDAPSVAPQTANAAAPASSGPGDASHIRVACEKTATRISPFIYGIAGTADGLATLGPPVRRWGGNPSSRYNWEGSFWNTARDWFFENQTAPAYDAFLAETTQHGAVAAVTVPMIGWVAKDGTSYSFPVSAFGPQAATDPWRQDVGNGVAKAGQPIAPGPATRTSVPAPPEWARRWVSAIVARDARAGKRSVYEYILDNEPMLWSSTHRDVHPEPVGYDELLDRSLQYASAIRAADPDAIIAGPAEWGWSAYMYSAKDLAGHGFHTDRLLHGNVALVEWYLREMRSAEKKAGRRLLDVFDLHYYPQANNVYGGGAGGADRQTQLLRLRSTRSLWDPTYVDESWVNDTVRLLPRMREWVDKNYPGTGISIGEWNFGGEKDVTGALSTAEALGRFAQFGVTSAFYWSAPPAGSPSTAGFFAFRNFDGRGGHFLDWFLPSTGPEGTSVFASREADGKHLVVVAINMSPDRAFRADLDLGACGTVATGETYVYSNGAAGFVKRQAAQDTAAFLHQTLEPWSITVLDIRLGASGR